MDKSFILLISQFGILAILTGLLPILKSLLSVLSVIIDLALKPENAVQSSTYLRRHRKIYFGLATILFISTLGGLLAAIFPGHLVFIIFYITLALAGTNKNYGFWIWLLDLGWYIELGAINKLLSGQLPTIFYFGTFLSYISCLIIGFIGFFMFASLFLHGQSSPVMNINNENLGQKSPIQNYPKYLLTFLLLIFCSCNLFALLNIAKALEISVFAIITLSLHSLLGQVFLIGKKISLNSLTNSREKFVKFFLHISITAIGLSLGWGLGVKTFISH